MDNDYLIQKNNPCFNLFIVTIKCTFTGSKTINFNSPLTQDMITIIFFLLLFNF